MTSLQDPKNILLISCLTMLTEEYLLFQNTNLFILRKLAHDNYTFTQISTLSFLFIVKKT